MTPYQKHKWKWSKCTRCSLHEQRNHVVLVRGKLPAPILFIGEAPGASEDVLGKPFVGPAGKLLDHIIDVAVDGRYDYAMTNLVACIPKDEDGNKTVEPETGSIVKCKPRLVELAVMAKPQLVVCVGKLAAKHIAMSLFPLGVIPSLIVEIHHPAFILRLDESQKGLAVRRCIVGIEDAIVGAFGEDAVPF